MLMPLHHPEMSERAKLLLAFQQWTRIDLPPTLACHFLSTSKLFYLGRASDRAMLTKELVQNAMRDDLRAQIRHLLSTLVQRSIVYGDKVSKAMQMLGCGSLFNDPLKAHIHAAVLGVWGTSGRPRSGDETIDMAMVSLEWMLESAKLVFVTENQEEKMKQMERAIGLLEQMPPWFRVSPRTRDGRLLKALESEAAFHEMLKGWIGKYLMQRFDADVLSLALKVGESLSLSTEFNLGGWPDSSEFSGPQLMLLHASGATYRREVENINRMEQRARAVGIPSNNTMRPPVVVVRRRAAAVPLVTAVEAFASGVSRATSLPSLISAVDAFSSALLPAATGSAAPAALPAAAPARRAAAEPAALPAAAPPAASFASMIVANADANAIIEHNANVMVHNVNVMAHNAAVLSTDDIEEEEQLMISAASAMLSLASSADNDEAVTQMMPPHPKRCRMTNNSWSSDLFD